MSSLHVLVVEDQALHALLIEDLLGSRGHELSVFKTGYGALAAVRAGERFDVAVVDLGLPDIDGVALIRALREHIAFLPILVCTGFTTLRDSADEELRASPTALAVLGKPYDEAEFVATVEWLGGRCEDLKPRQA